MRLYHKPWKVRKYLFKKWLPFEKKVSFLTCFFGNSEFFKNSKIKNFDLSVVKAIEECIGEHSH